MGASIKKNVAKVEAKSEVIFDESPVNKKISFNIIHFNDIYSVEDGEIDPVGGAARFVHLVESIKKTRPTLVAFSGDAFSPNHLSMILKGKQMAEVMNLCQVDVSCIGNHDFDFGVETLQGLMKVCKFPWLLSNVFDENTNKPLANGFLKKIIIFQGIKIGFIGLVEEEWIATLATIDYDDLKYESFILAGKRLAQQMKRDEKVDYVIALTHMRQPNDEILVNAAPEIDLFLGGHDHDYCVKNINDRWLVKSGTNFKEFTLIEMSSVNGPKNLRVTKIEKLIVDSSVQENVKTKQLVLIYTASVNKLMDTVLGRVNTDLDGRFSVIRSQESNLGNFICDTVLSVVEADVCILNAGVLRSDRIHPKGDFKMRDLNEILPYATGIFVLSVTGEQVVQALENGVSGYPKHEGRFPQVSGLRFQFDPSKPPFKRINTKTVTIKNKTLQMKHKYRVATSVYLAEGKDGFDVFKSCPVLVEDECTPLLYTIVENHFKTIESLRKNPNSRLRPNIVPIHVVNSIVKDIGTTGNVFKPQFKNSDDEHITFRTAAQLVLKTIRLQRTISRKDKKLIKKTSEFKQKVLDHEKQSMKLAPEVDGRIQCLA